VRLPQAREGAQDLVGGLVRRIHQHQPSSLGWRQQCFCRYPGIHVRHPGAIIAAESLFERGVVHRLQLVEKKAVFVAAEAA
jgi:hypothetical protein